MLMIHIWNWLLNLMGVHFGENKFSTHMYNFWSGFGGDITEFALIGTIFAIYRNHLNYLKKINPLTAVRKGDEELKKQLNKIGSTVSNISSHEAAEDERDKEKKD